MKWLYQPAGCAAQTITEDEARQFLADQYGDQADEILTEVRCGQRLTVDVQGGDLLTTPDQCRLHLRMRPKLGRLLERAATAEGMTVPEYAKHVILQASLSAVETHDQLAFTDEDRDAFAEAWDTIMDQIQ